MSCLRHQTTVIKSIILFICLAMGVNSAWAQSASVWDGSTIPASIAAANIAGAGTETSPYIIDNANKFVCFGNVMNNNKAYWRLESDIDLGGHEWPFSGNSAKTFQGHFDGGGHTVGHYAITPISTKTNGLFGTLAGQSRTNRAEVKNLTISNVAIAQTADLATTTYIGALAGNVSQYTDLKNISLNSVSISTANITGTCYVGALVGRLQKNSTVDTCTITAPTIGITGNISGATYIGGAIGSIESAAGDPSSVTAVTITGADIALGGNLSASPVYVGGIAGQLLALAQPNRLVQCSVAGAIRVAGNHTFAENKTYAFGGIVGYMGQSATTFSELSQCISEVDFSLGGLTPSTMSGSNCNLYRNGFVVGGVIGRIYTPSRLPEQLYYSGKIYAPFAAVAPIVGVFCTNLNAAAYVYSDYFGSNAANLTAQEWGKASSWYYSAYKLGLLQAVTTQTARTRNYTATPVTEDGVKYLTVDESTFNSSDEPTVISKYQQTVLRYNLNNSNTKTGIYPQWGTNDATYASYYMYYMQGVNHGVHVQNADFVKTLIAEGLATSPKVLRTGDTYAVDAGPAATAPGISISYQWYGWDDTTMYAGATSNTFSPTTDQMETADKGVWCDVTLNKLGYEPFSRKVYGSDAVVVYVDNLRGADNAAGSRLRGWTPEMAVKTIDNANLLLDGGSWNKNHVVIIGYHATGTGTNAPFQSRGPNPATYTGRWAGIEYDGIINMVKTSETGANPGDGLGRTGFHNYVSADTKFEYLTLAAAHDVDNMFLECHSHDVWLGKGLRMLGFRSLSASHGNIDGQTIPELSVILTSTNPAHPDEAYWTRTKPQVLTIESGHYGRILGGRYTSNFFTRADNTSHSILATASHPAWAVINIDIDAENDMKSADGKVTYTCDVNCIVAGLTDGSIYGDYQINIHGGDVRYAVGANQGNSVVNGSKNYTPVDGTYGNWGQYPNASFFGRTVINVEQGEGLKPIIINNLYAGGLGRNADAGSSVSTVVDMYVYGHTEINIKSGTVNNNVYGGGAGGVIGLCPWDAHVPYATTAANDNNTAVLNGVQYGTWDSGSMPQGSPLVAVTLHNPDGLGSYTTESLNLANSSTTLNISGGHIGGEVYGGGDGYVSNMPIGGTMQGVGSVFGTSNINITGGEITGSVYGGSQGNANYYDKKNKYGQTINHIAEMNGTVNLTITGTDEKWPTIGGDIYGAGAGVESVGGEEYLRIATAGDAPLGQKYKTDINILIDLPTAHPFEHDIYGGGQMGLVDGTTNVVIKSGIVNGDVFGAGKGELGHPDKAKVTGNTTVTVSNSTVLPATPHAINISGSVFGGGSAAQVEGDPTVIIRGEGETVEVAGDVFGGGLGTTATVTGNTEVKVTGSSIVNSSVYGGGNGGVVTGTTHVQIGECD